MTDPYLKLGARCDVWADKNLYVDMGYFLQEIDGLFIFSNSLYKGKPDITNTFVGSHYRPINTEWDYAPDWVVCSVMDYGGLIEFFDTQSVHPDDINWRENEYGGIKNYMICGICPDKSRYQGDAWKTSLRMRPVWAGGRS